MTSRQFAEWVAYAAVEPFGEERDDYRIAYALAVILNFFKGKEGAPVTAADLMPHVGELAEDDWSGDEEGEDGEEPPPKHPNVILFEQMLGL